VTISFSAHLVSFGHFFPDLLRASTTSRASAHPRAGRSRPQALGQRQRPHAALLLSSEIVQQDTAELEQRPPEPRDPWYSLLTCAVGRTAVAGCDLRPGGATCRAREQRSEALADVPFAFWPKSRERLRVSAMRLWLAHSRQTCRRGPTAIPSGLHRRATSSAKRGLSERRKPAETRRPHPHDRAWLSTVHETRTRSPRSTEDMCPRA